MTFARPMSWRNRLRASLGDSYGAHVNESVRQGGHFNTCWRCRDQYWVRSNESYITAENRHKRRECGK